MIPLTALPPSPSFDRRVAASNAEMRDIVAMTRAFTGLLVEMTSNMKSSYETSQLLLEDFMKEYRSNEYYVDDSNNSGGHTDDHSQVRQQQHQLHTTILSTIKIISTSMEMMNAEQQLLYDSFTDCMGTFATSCEQHLISSLELQQEVFMHSYIRMCFDMKRTIACHVLVSEGECQLRQLLAVLFARLFWTVASLVTQNRWATHVTVYVKQQ
jgi:hypothetical protein